MLLLPRRPVMILVQHFRAARFNSGLTLYRSIAPPTHDRLHHKIRASAVRALPRGDVQFKPHARVNIAHANMHIVPQ